MLCYLVYDIRTDPYDMSGVWFGLLFVAFGILTWRLNRERTFFQRWAFLLFAATWTTIVAYDVIWHAHALRRDVATGHYDVVTGEITTYDAVRPGAKGTDSFIVDGVHFVVSEYEMSPGFHQTRRQGSPLNEGTYVRLGYVDETIVRIEICDPKARTN